MNNDFENDKNINNNNNDDNLSEVQNDNENSQDIQGGEKQGEQVTEIQEKAAEDKEETAVQEEGDNREEGKDAGENGEGSDINAEGCEASYEPPEYVPDFTIVGETPPKEQPKEKKDKRMSNGAIIALCAATLVLSLIIGAFAGAIAGGVIEINLSGRDNSELVNIIRSDREFVVEEIPGNSGYTDLSVSQVAALVGESVVEITTTQKQTGIGGQYIQSGAGSGVIFDQDGNKGKIVTNYHVIEGADAISVRVKRGDGYEDYAATYIAGDDGEDIAVIEIITKDDHVLSRAVFANSDNLQVGQQVVAIGNPLGQLGGTVTDGIVSALDRQIAVGDYTMQLLQTNAAINPGNSGGGLFDMNGELIGIVNAKQSSTGIEGLGFAIPSNIVANDIADIMEVGYIRGRKMLGISAYQGQFTSGEYTIVVENPGNTPLQKNDCIVEIEGDKIQTLADYHAAIEKHAIGKEITVKVVRNRKYETVKVTVLEDTSK